MESGASGKELLIGIVDVDALTADERAKLGAAIKELRMARGLSQSDIADAANITRKTYGTLERGERAAHAGNLRKVLEVLGIPQVSDFDRYDEGTRMFIAITAPMFGALPESARAGAQQDVIALLGAKIERAAKQSEEQYVGPHAEDEIDIVEPRQTDVALAAKRRRKKIDEAPWAE
jgi:transcriptional regulator with XRE-family HTH domain